MDENQYFEERLEEQITWYDKNSLKHKNTYYKLKVIQIILSTLIPFLVGFVKFHGFFTLLVGVLGVSIASIEGILTLGKYHENWIEYRRICETLKHEKYMYSTRTGIYKNEAPFENLVERVESIISQENINWAALRYEENNKIGDG